MVQNTARTKGFSPQGATVAAAVGGLLVGLVANVGRKAFVQGLGAATGEWDDVLKAEHEVTSAIFAKLRDTSTDHTKKRKMLLMQLKHALSKHAFEEENVVYPTMREHGLTEEADHLNHDHGYVKQFLFELTEIPPSDPAWIEKVEEFQAHVEKHVRQEEDELFPLLRQKLGEDGNALATAAVNKEGFKLA
jgi:hemerythrin-like domain-containing protein